MRANRAYLLDAVVRTLHPSQRKMLADDLREEYRRRWLFGFFTGFLLSTAAVVAGLMLYRMGG